MTPLLFLPFFFFFLHEYNICSLIKTVVHCSTSFCQLNIDYLCKIAVFFFPVLESSPAVPLLYQPW